MFVLYEILDQFPESFKPTFSEKLNKLFFFLKKDKGLSEHDAGQKFLGENFSFKYFNKLKNALKERLTDYMIINSLIWVDADYKTLQEGCYKNFSVYKILLMSGNRKAAIEIAKKLLPKLRKVELHSLIYIIATDLQFHYSSIEIRPGLTKKYGKIARAQLNIINAESIVREHHSEVGLIGNTKESFSPKIIEQFKVAAREVMPYLELGSNQLNRLIYNIVISRYYVEYDYKNIIIFCNKALQNIPKDHPNYVAFRFSLLHKQIPAMVATRQLKEAKELAREACKLMPVGKFNWHLALIRRISICLQAEDYQEAYDLFKAHSRHQCPYQPLLEYWNILRGYLYFLIHQGKIQPYREEKFSLGKFLNEVPMFSRDKSGFNINILILRILIQMQRGQYGLIIDQIDSLSTYASTYTRNPETKRVNLFIKMILIMVSSSFHKAATERKTKKLFDRLNNSQLKIGQNMGVEILPFSKLWEEILGMLENKFRGVTVK